AAPGQQGPRRPARHRAGGDTHQAHRGAAPPARRAVEDAAHARDTREGQLDPGQGQGHPRVARARRRSRSFIMSPGATTDTLVAFRMEAPAAAEDGVVTALWERGTTGVHVQPGSPGTVVLVAYFPDTPGLAAGLRSTLSACGVTHLEPAAIPDVDWVTRFREGFRAFDVGGFHIVPAWEPPPEGLAVGRTLRVLPARAFGTGTHESTRLCLSALQALAARRRPGRVVDVGTGTGILAVAAAL